MSHTSTEFHLIQSGIFSSNPAEGRRLEVCALLSNILEIIFILFILVTLQIKFWNI